MSAASAVTLPLPAHVTDKTILSVTSLSLHHFRNYGAVRLEITPAPVVLTGRNGAGKTNILEALSLLTPGRGLRRARLGEMDNCHEPGRAWTVAATVRGIQGETKIGTGRDVEMDTDKRAVRIDGKDIRSQAELGHHMAMVWLTPQMEQLFNDGASAGRKFLDRLVYSFDPDHASRINEYEYAMRERNRLLSMGRGDPLWLDSLELTMAETGAAIAAARLHTATNINHAIAASGLGFPKAHITVRGFMEERLEMGENSITVENIFRAALAEARGQDAAAGRTLAGTHRSEMRVTHSEKNLPAEVCSTGEQKAMLLSMVLAQARAGMMWKGVVPVLLLDEVIAHLDATRRLELFEEICQIGAQVWMTGTDEKTFAELSEKVQYFRVENGSIF